MQVRHLSAEIPNRPWHARNHTNTVSTAHRGIGASEDEIKNPLVTRPKSKLHIDLALGFGRHMHLSGDDMLNETGICDSHIPIPSIIYWRCRNPVCVSQSPGASSESISLESVWEKPSFQASFRNCCLMARFLVPPVTDSSLTVS